MSYVNDLVKAFHFLLALQEVKAEIKAAGAGEVVTAPPITGIDLFGREGAVGITFTPGK